MPPPTRCASRATCSRLPRAAATLGDHDQRLPAAEECILVGGNRRLQTRQGGRYGSRECMPRSASTAIDAAVASAPALGSTASIWASAISKRPTVYGLIRPSTIIKGKTFGYKAAHVHAHPDEIGVVARSPARIAAMTIISSSLLWTVAAIGCIRFCRCRRERNAFVSLHVQP